MKNLLRVLLALSVFVIPAVAQSSSDTQGDQSKSSIQSAGTATKDAAKDAGSATVSGTKAAADKVTGKTDINSASKDDLMKIDGIGDATSAKIIAGRPYRTKRELLTRNIVNQSTYDKISGKIVAHASKATMATN